MQRSRRSGSEVIGSYDRLLVLLRLPFRRVNSYTKTLYLRHGVLAYSVLCNLLILIACVLRDLPTVNSPQPKEDQSAEPDHPP